MTATSRATRPAQDPLGDGTRVTIRAAGGRDIGALLGVADGDPWPTLPLAGAPAEALPGSADGASLVLLALDEAGTCLGLASYDRPDDGTAATFAVDLSAPARGRGVAAALLRRLAEAAARQGIRELHGSIAPAEARELVAAVRPPARRLLSVAGGRWHVAEYLTLPDAPRAGPAAPEHAGAAGR